MSDETQTSMPVQAAPNAINLLYPILAGICVMLSGAAFKWSFDANANMAKSEVVLEGKATSAEVKAVQVQMVAMQKSIDKLSEKSDLDKKQDSSISKHWKLHNWSRDEINNIKFKNGEAPVSWPSLDGPLDWNR